MKDNKPEYTETNDISREFMWVIFSGLFCCF